jgi:hypothetical protein
MKPWVTRACLIAALLGVTAACGSDDDAKPAQPDAGTATTLSKSCPADTPEFSFGTTGLTSEPNAKLDYKAHLVDAS